MYRRCAGSAAGIWPSRSRTSWWSVVRRSTTSWSSVLVISVCSSGVDAALFAEVGLHVAAGRGQVVLGLVERLQGVGVGGIEVGERLAHPVQPARQRVPVGGDRLRCLPPAPLGGELAERVGDRGVVALERGQRVSDP